MISPAHVQVMARYNQWQNTSLYTAADTLSDAERRKDRGAFFGSIFGTLNHLLWGDLVWLARLGTAQKPSISGKESPALVADWDSLKTQRHAMDDEILRWAATMTTEALAADHTWYSGAAGREVTKPTWLLVTHLFNHQTHHRGQVHAMLTQAGAKPDDTDLFLLP